MLDRLKFSKKVSAYPLTTLFVFALAIRWIYALVIYRVNGNDGLMSGDSFGFLSNAQLLASKVGASNPIGWEWLGTDLAVMPLYPWLLTVNVLVAGSMAPLITVFVQGIFDALTCTVVCRIGRIIDPPSSTFAGALAAINPTQIVLSGLIYTDTLFLFFSTLLLLTLLRWNHTTTWRWTCLIGIAGGLAAVTRVLIVPWIVAALGILVLTKIVAGRLTREHVVQMTFVAALVTGFLSPVLTRNITFYDAWALTPQGGAHLAFWVAPLVNEISRGTPRDVGARQAEARLRDRYPSQHTNAFVEAQRLTEIGREVISEAGYFSVAKAWAVGAVINLATPAALISPPVAQLPHTGFYDTRGATFAEKVFNFAFRSGNAIYVCILLVGAAGVLVFGVFVVLGVLEVFRHRGWDLSIAVLLLWIGFVLAVNGPIASPKYRLPVEPVLCLLAAAGLSRVRTLPRSET